MSRKYRPVAPDNIDKLVGDLRRLAGETILPWQHDHQTGEFFVEVDGQVHPVTFGPGDSETQLVTLLTANLDVLLDAVAEKFVLIDREWVCRPKGQSDEGS